MAYVYITLLLSLGEFQARLPTPFSLETGYEQL